MSMNGEFLLNIPAKPQAFHYIRGGYKISMPGEQSNRGCEGPGEAAFLIVIRTREGEDAAPGFSLMNYFQFHHPFEDRQEVNFSTL